MGALSERERRSGGCSRRRHTPPARRSVRAPGFRTRPMQVCAAGPSGLQRLLRRFAGAGRFARSRSFRRTYDPRPPSCPHRWPGRMAAYRHDRRGPVAVLAERELDVRERCARSGFRGRGHDVRLMRHLEAPGPGRCDRPTAHTGRGPPGRAGAGHAARWPACRRSAGPGAGPGCCPKRIGQAPRADRPARSAATRAATRTAASSWLRGTPYPSAATSSGRPARNSIYLRRLDFELARHSRRVLLARLRGPHQTGLDLSRSSQRRESLQVTGGGRGIRTHEELAPLAVFKTAAIGL